MNNLRKNDDIFLKQREQKLKCHQEMRLMKISNFLRENHLKRWCDRKEIDGESINHIENLLNESLRKTDDFEEKKENVINAFKEFNPCQYSWEKYYNFIDKGYTRNLVIENDLFELMIICWDKDCKTSIHDHPSDGCWMIGLEGRIFEEKFSKNTDKTLSKSCQSEFGEGEIAWIHDSIGFHAVGNMSKFKKAATLHLYSPPIRICNSYQKNGSTTSRNMKYYITNTEKL